MTKKNQPQEKGQKQQTGLKKFEEETVGKVLGHIDELQNTGELVLPKNYVPGNALKFAWLHLQTVKDKNKRAALDVCTKLSIVNSLLEMTVKGMSVAKKHGAFIVRGNQLTWQDQYFGNLMRAKRDAEVKDVNARTIYEGDEYITRVNERGVKELVKHDSPIENIDSGKIRGAYAIVEYTDGRLKLTEMTIGQIRKAWDQGDAKGQSKAHQNFTDQMCERTVINRACKVALNSSDDSGIIRDDQEHESLPAKEARDKGIEEGERKERRMLDISDAEEMEVTDDPQANEDEGSEDKAPGSQEENPVSESQDKANDDAVEPPAPDSQQRVPDF